ncbi:iron transporter [Salinirubellus sp. GCM10025818]|uniref:iron transporter n=1 Tax=Salinirubellus TaxID=2162630 RepID=UPI0030D5CC27
MRRRDFVEGIGLAGVAGLAGCAGLVETRSIPSTPPVLEDRPDAVYFPTHVEGMEMAGMGESGSGEYAFGLTYSYPHRFWNVNGGSVQLTEIESDDDVHLMASVWDPETRTVLPEAGLSLEITRDGELVSEEVIYPMLSQPMGFHYGANFGLDGDGTYTVTVSVGGVSTRKTGAFVDRFADPASAGISFDYSQSIRDEIMFENTPDRAGEAAAVDPMEMMMPNAVAPAEGDLPGEVLATGTSGDAVLVVGRLDAPPEGVDGDGEYLYVSARTPYNRMVIPAMAVTGTLSRSGETVFEGDLARTLDPDLGYHYGAALGDTAVESGDDLALEVPTPPQVARHEGYETAFVDMAPVEVSL